MPDTIAEGTTESVSDWITVDQGLIDRFAEVTDDHQFIHVNPERAARESVFGGTIAHGFLVLSLLSKLNNETLSHTGGVEVNYGFDKVRFLSPVRAGSRIRARFTPAGRNRKGSGLLETFDVTVEIEGEEKPALVARWNILKVE